MVSRGSRGDQSLEGGGKSHMNTIEPKGGSGQFSSDTSNLLPHPAGLKAE